MTLSKQFKIISTRHLYHILIILVNSNFSTFCVILDFNEDNNKRIKEIELWCVDKQISIKYCVVCVVCVHVVHSSHHYCFHQQELDLT